MDLFQVLFPLKGSWTKGETGCVWEHSKNIGPDRSLSCCHGVRMWIVVTPGHSWVNFMNTQNQPDGYNYILATQILISSRGKKKKKTASKQEPPHKPHHTAVPGVHHMPNQANCSSSRPSWNLWQAETFDTGSDSRLKGLLWEDSACGNETQSLTMVASNSNLHDRTFPSPHHPSFFHSWAPLTAAKINRSLTG